MTKIRNEVKQSEKGKQKTLLYIKTVFISWEMSKEMQLENLTFTKKKVKRMF